MTHRRKVAKVRRWLALPCVAFFSFLVAGPAWGDTLSVTATDVNFPDLTLTGQNQTTTAAASSAWTIADVGLTGPAWTVSISATAPTSAAGTVETTARSIAVGNLVVSTGSFTASLGSNPATPIVGVSGLTLTTLPQTLAVSSGNTIGTYSFTPTFSLTMPGNAFRSNYSAIVGASTLNPYTSTITVTIA
ncbi:MAG: WxL domain-containing protein [Actinomycetota bacterium]